jgi:MFS family permease
MRTPFSRNLRASGAGLYGAEVFQAPRDRKKAPPSMPSTLGKLSSPLDPQKTYRTLLWRLMPVLMVCYILNYIDRSNIGLAKLQFMQDLGMPEAAYGLAAGSFYLGYISFGVPINILLSKIGARKGLLAIMVCWGLLSASLAFATSPSHFYILRFLIGVAETGFLPAVLLYLSRWVPQEQRARFNGIFLAAIAIGGLIGGPLGGYIMKAANGMFGMRGWQLLFVIEGLPACAMGLFAFLYLKERPRDAAWLTDAQKRQIEEQTSEAGRLGRQGSQSDNVHTSLLAALRDKRFLALVAIAISGSIGTSAIGLWLPTIIRNSGVSDILAVGALSAIPNGAAVFIQYFNARHSDRTGERRWHAAGPLLVGAAGWCAMPLTAHNSWLSVILMTVIACATFSFTGPFWSMPTTLLSGAAAAGGLGVITSMLGLGSFVSPVLVGWLSDRTHTLAAGELYFALVLCLGSTALLLGTRPRIRID